MIGTTGTAPEPLAPGRSLGGAFAALRIFIGLVWLSNALAKVFDVTVIDWGFFSFNLITRGTARGILTDAAARTQITALGTFYRDFVLPHWGVFGILLTLGELAVGLGLLFGVATRLAALGGLLLIAPIWLMLWHTNGYLWEYPLALFPLLLLAIVPAGRVLGLDRGLAPGSTAGGRFHPQH